MECCKEDVYRYFWSKIQTVIGVVPASIQRTLEVQGYAASAGLGDISVIDIKEIECAMQKCADHYSMLLEPEHFTELYGIFSNNPEQFCFMGGERKSIMKAAEAVQRYGIASFLPVTSASVTASAPRSVPSTIDASTVAEVIGRLLAYFSQRLTDTLQHKEFLTALKTIPTLVTRDEHDSTIAIVTCIFCSPAKPLKIVKADSGTWLTGNFVKHCSQYHVLLPSEGRKKRTRYRRPGCSASEEEWLDLSTEDTSREDSREEVLSTLPDVKANDHYSIAVGLIEETTGERADPLPGDEIEAVGSIEETTGERANPLSGDEAESPNPLSGDEMNDEHTIEDDDDNDDLKQESPNCLSDEAREESLIIESREESLLSLPAEADNNVHNVNATNPSATLAGISDAPLLDSLARIHNSTRDKKPHARRYTTLEKDVCCYEFLTSGNAHYKYLRANSSVMSSKTIQRYISNTNNIREGLKDYLLRNNFPLIVTLCEDATKITSAVEYDYKEDKLRGLVSPLNEHGLPDMTKFEVKSPITMKQDVRNYALGEYAYVQLAIPLAADAAPYVLYHFCSDNRFKSEDVLNRWKYTEDALFREGIQVIANCSDGDPRLLKAMKIRAGFEQDPIPSQWGPWFNVHNQPNKPFNVQDMVHAVNKFRNRLLNCDMEIGNFKITALHLRELVCNHSKDKHQLTMSDVNLKDKMKFGPTLKLMNPVMIDFLEENVRDSAGTAFFLRIMRLMYRSFIEEELSPLERVHDLWAANFMVRAWRNWCKTHHKNLKQCVTTNAYLSLELNAHALITFMKDCRERNAPEQFLMSALSSQPCEELFREMRSMSTTNQTVVNFTIKEFTNKLKRLQMKTNIMYRNQTSITYPIHQSLHKKRRILTSLPLDKEIENAVTRAQNTAQEAMLRMGVIDADMSSSVFSTPMSEPLHTEFVNLDEHVKLEEGIAMQPEETVPIETEFISLGIHENLYEATELFPNCEGSLNLKSSTVGEKHCFKIRNFDGKIKTIKKSSLLWMLMPARSRLSTDRMRRFIHRAPKMSQPDNVSEARPVVKPQRTRKPVKDRTERSRGDNDF